MECGAVPRAASACVNQIENRGCRYVAERNWQMRRLLDPRIRSRSKFPNRVGHRSIDSEPAENIELVIEHCEAAGQSYPVSIPRPRRGDGFDCIGNRVVAEYPVGCCGLTTCRATYTIDVVRPGICEHATSHVAHLVVRIGGRFDCPSVCKFKRMDEIVACAIHAAAAHYIEGPVVEENADSAHSGTWHVGSGLPASGKRTTKTNEARWILLLHSNVRLPLSKGGWDDTDGQKWEQVERGANKMRSNRGKNVRFHFPDGLTSEPLLFESPQRCRDFSAATYIAPMQLQHSSRDAAIAFDRNSS